MQSERNKAIEWIPFTFDEKGSIDYYLDYADELEGLAWRPLPEPYIRGDQKMNLNIDNDKLIRVIKTYGVQAQITVLFEEMAELQKELCKQRRKQGNIEQITEELADVLIMLKQLQVILNLPDERVQEIINYKMERLSVCIERERMKQ